MHAQKRIREKYKKRLLSILLPLSSLGIGTYIILYYLNQSITLYHSPSGALSASSENQSLRIGGEVVVKSVEYIEGGIQFSIKDQNHSIPIIYHGIIPSLFKEGQTAVVYGKMKNNIFYATELLAKHDEYYKPKK